MATISGGPGVTYDPDGNEGLPGGPAGPLNPDGTIPDSQIHFGDPGDPAGPLGGDGKIPADQLPPLQHDVGEAANEAAMLALDVEAPAICIRTDFDPPHVFYLTADPATDANNWVDTGEFGGGGANPTAMVGITAINGAANTFMRSDAAPAINQGIAPTWTASHVFAKQGGGAAASIQTRGFLAWEYNAGGTDAKWWDAAALANTLNFRAVNDANSSSQNWLTITRNGAAIQSQQWLIANATKMTLDVTALQLLLPETIITGTDGSKLWLGKYSSGSGHSNAPTSIGAASTYLYVGGREYGNNGYGGIGFSYVADTTNHPAVWIGWQETNTAGNTLGDFIIATRNVTTNTAPTARMRVTAAGDIAAASGYVPANALSLATKDYVDTHAGSGVSGTYVPTLTIGAGSTVTQKGFWYTRVGDVVQVSGSVDLTAASAGNVPFTVSLPVASTLSDQFGVVGTTVSYDGISGDPDAYGTVFADNANNRANVNLMVPNTNQRFATVQFSYVVV